MCLQIFSLCDLKDEDGNPATPLFVNSCTFTKTWWGVVGKYPQKMGMIFLCMQMISRQMMKHIYKFKSDIGSCNLSRLGKETISRVSSRIILIQSFKKRNRFSIESSFWDWMLDKVYQESHVDDWQKLAADYFWELLLSEASLSPRRQTKQ